MAALARPVALPFLGLVFLFLIFRSNPRAAFPLLLGAVIVIGPWTAWKSQEAGRFVLIASEGGITFWTGNNPRAIGEGDLAANPAMKQRNQEIREQVNRSGRIYLSGTRLGGRFTIRVALGNPRAEDRHVRECRKQLEEAARAVADRR